LPFNADMSHSNMEGTSSYGLMKMMPMNTSRATVPKAEPTSAMVA